MKPNSSPQVLVVEDEAGVAGLLATSLQIAGYGVTVAQNAEQALALVAARGFDAAIVDWMLPGLTGIELTQQLRRAQKTRALPILMLTARASENDKIAGFDAGADDYLVKPFSPRELTARINALLRRAQPLRSESELSFEQLRLNPASASAYFLSSKTDAAPTAIELSSTEFKLLHCMMLQSQRLHTREHLMAQVWGADASIDSRTIDAHIKRLRQALAEAGCPPYIETVRGLGYKLNAAAMGAPTL